MDKLQSLCNVQAGKRGQVQLESALGSFKDCIRLSCWRFSLQLNSVLYTITWSIGINSIID